MLLEPVLVVPMCKVVRVMRSWYFWKRWKVSLMGLISLPCTTGAAEPPQATDVMDAERIVTGDFAVM